MHAILTACLKPLRAGLAQWLQEGRVADPSRELPLPPGDRDATQDTTKWVRVEPY